jgi:hypothetical protein
MEDIANRIMDEMPNLNKPQRKFMLKLFSVLMTFVGKANFRNLSRYGNMHEKTIARWFRISFDYLTFNTFLLRSELSQSSEKIAALDASFMSKSGKKTDGLGKFWNGKNSKSEKGLEISLLAVVDMESNTAYPLEAKQTIDVDNENHSRIDTYTKQVQDCAPNLKDLAIKHLAVDAYYAKSKFVNGVLQTGLDLVGKLRCDADLRWNAESKHIGIGRPKKFDSKFNLEEDLDRLTHVARLEDNVDLYTAVLYSKNLERNVKVSILRWDKHSKIGYAILYSTDLDLSAEKILAYYKARFQIEFVFRDAKQHTGLTDCQSTKKEAIYQQVNASLATLSLLKLEDKNGNLSKQSNVISITSWKRKKFNQHYMKLLFSNLGLELTCQKVSSVFDKFSDYGAIAA